MGTENRWEYRFGTLSPGAVNVGSLGQKVVGRNSPARLMIRDVANKPNLAPIQALEAAKQKAHRNGRAF